MSATQKKKLCWNCEGRVPLEEENCPYCAVYLGPAPDEKRTDILTPPYRLVDSEEDEEIPASPYAVEKEGEEEEEESGIDISVARSDLKSVILPLILLSMGSMSFLFGIILLLFSSHGIFTLTWNGDYWYVYLLSALPMLFLGWRVLRKLQEEEPLEPVPESHPEK
ncbi:MAG: hypothetical protein ACE5GN_01200 [Waddliaceae bacterium]